MATAALYANRPEPVEGTYNFRSTGGYAAGERRVREGKLFRSDGLHRLADPGRERLRDLGVGLVVDLRDPSERATAPNLLDGLTLEQAHVPVFDAGAVPGAGQLTELAPLAEIYRQMVVLHAPRLAAAVRRIADSGEVAVVVHCHAGKDRTGLVIALALLAAGVDREQVLADYAASAENLAGAWAEEMLQAVSARAGGVVSETLREVMTLSPAASLAHALDIVDAEHGGAAGFLAAHGFAEEDLRRLRDVLTH